MNRLSAIVSISFEEGKQWKFIPTNLWSDCSYEPLERFHMSGLIWPWMVSVSTGKRWLVFDGEEGNETTLRSSSTIHDNEPTRWNDPCELVEWGWSRLFNSISDSIEGLVRESGEGWYDSSFGEERCGRNDFDGREGEFRESLQMTEGSVEDSW